LLSGWINRFSSQISRSAAEPARPGESAASRAGLCRTMEPLETRLMLTANVNGTVYNDANANGVFDNGEIGIAGVTVYIDLNDSNQFVANDPHTTTDANGNYSLPGIVPGTYVVRQILPTGAVNTDPGNNAGDHITVGAIDTNGVNFGDVFPPATFSISGEVYNDSNNNGQLDEGENGIANVTVYIDVNDTHSFVQTDPHVVTNAMGQYSFTGLASGTYILRQIPPTGTQQTEPAGNIGQHVTATLINSTGIDFGDFTPDGAVTSANMNEITGYAYDPTNSATQVDVEISISGGPSQTIVANQTNASLQTLIGSTNHEFTYDTPVLSVGAHTVNIVVFNPTTNVTNELATETVVSQNSLFDEHYYLQQNPDVAAAVAAGTFATGYDHFIKYGQYENRSPSPYWNEAYYLQQNPDVAAAIKAGTISSGFMHYYLYGQNENRGGLLYFNTQYYLQNNPDVAAAVTAKTIPSAFEHFVLYGQYENRAPMLYFSSSVYDADNHDILAFTTGEGFSSDFEHFVEYGQFEGRVASLFYNEQTYLSLNPDVATAVAQGKFPDGLQHWLEYGQYEGRRAV
jgi:hypothetical protein